MTRDGEGLGGTNNPFNEPRPKFKSSPTSSELKSGTIDGVGDVPIGEGLSVTGEPVATTGEDAENGGSTEGLSRADDRVEARP